MNERMEWEDYFMLEAHLAATRRTCPSRAVGAVAVKNKRIISKGFNGPPTGYEHPTCCVRKNLGCASGTRMELCPCRHAEDNLITNASRMGVSLEGATVYVTTFPCQNCMGMLANAGISTIVYEGTYDVNNGITRQTISAANINCIQHVPKYKIEIQEIQNA